MSDVIEKERAVKVFNQDDQEQIFRGGVLEGSIVAISVDGWAGSAGLNMCPHKYAAREQEEVFLRGRRGYSR